MKSLLQLSLARKSPVAADSVTERTIRLLFAMLSPMQQKFVRDPRRHKLARCTRRAGKTYAVAAYMIIECLQKKNTPVLYAGLTRDSAKEAVWPILTEMLEVLQIPCQPKESTLQIHFPNGSKIVLFGCDAQNARNRLRGRKFKLICFDETAFLASLDPLVTAVLPMLADLGGTLCLTSSPGELLQGLFFEADQGKYKEDWSRYEWTIHDNPLFQQPSSDPRYKTRAEEELATVLKLEFKGKEKAPGYRREWLGEWVSDDTSLVYPVSGKNLIDAVSSMKQAKYVVGVEMGSSFNHSLVVGQYSNYSREFQIIHHWTRSDLELDELAQFIEAEVETFDPVAVVAHTGKFSLDVVDEMRRRYKLPIVGVQNDKDKSFYQRVFATDLANGYIKIKKGLPLLEEYAKIVRDKDGIEIEGQENYGSNAALVAYRKVYQTSLSSYEKPLSDEERHIQQLEQSHNSEETPWYERF